jgi:acetyl-CoA acetyltransferase
MIAAAVVGVGMTPFTKRSDAGIVQLGVDATLAAIADSGAPADKFGIDAAYVATGYGGAIIGQRVLGELGLSGVPIVNVENACAGGATALAEAVWAVRSGRYETVLALGIEQLSAFGSGTLPLTASDPEVQQGQVMPAVYAMRARRYMHDFGLHPEDLAAVTVKNRQNAALNPFARFREPVTVDEVLSSREVASPLTLLQCSANSDGAAAVIVTSADTAARFDAQPLRVAASALTSGRFATERVDMTWMNISERAITQAYAEAGIAPQDVDVCELHDAFSIAEIIYYEMLGFAERGKGRELLRNGRSGIDGDVAVNTSGGLIGRGHPVAATGLAQIVELAWQLRGTCGDRQVPGTPRVALAHVTGGGIGGFENAACSVHVLVNDLAP